MKRLLIVPALLVLVHAAAAESRLFLAGGASYLLPADEAYRAVYGDQAFYPEFSAAIRLVGGLCLTGSYGEFSKTGTTPNLGLETKATQSCFTAGLSYFLRASSLLCFEAGAGLAGFSFREEALDAVASGRHPGFTVGGGLLLAPEDGRVFLGLNIGYSSAQVDDIDSELAGPQPIRLGGLRLALRVGIQLFGND
jgi:hypothetical protein